MSNPKKKIFGLLYPLKDLENISKGYKNKAECRIWSAVKNDNTSEFINGPPFFNVFLSNKYKSV